MEFIDLIKQNELARSDYIKARNSLDVACVKFEELTVVNNTARANYDNGRVSRDKRVVALHHAAAKYDDTRRALLQANKLK